MPRDVDEIVRRVTRYYEACLRKHKDGPAAVDWNSIDSQVLRFSILADVGDLTRASVLDVGCGLGDLSKYLLRRFGSVRYEGIDISPSMIEVARAKYPGSRFRVANLLEDRSGKLWDYVLASGPFHVKGDVPARAWGRFVRRTVKAMFERARKAIAFNLMSDDVDYRYRRLYYARCSEFFDFCKRLSRCVVARHDYPLYEFTMYVYHRR